MATFFAMRLVGEEGFPNEVEVETIDAFKWADELSMHTIVRYLTIDNWDEDEYEVDDIEEYGDMFILTVSDRVFVFSENAFGLPKIVEVVHHIFD